MQFLHTEPYLSKSQIIGPRFHIFVIYVWFRLDVACEFRRDEILNGYLTELIKALLHRLSFGALLINSNTFSQNAL